MTTKKYELTCIAPAGRCNYYFCRILSGCRTLEIYKHTPISVLRVCLGIEGHRDGLGECKYLTIQYDWARCKKSMKQKL